MGESYPYLTRLEGTDVVGKDGFLRIFLITILICDDWKVNLFGLPGEK